MVAFFIEDRSKKSKFHADLKAFMKLTLFVTILLLEFDRCSHSGGKQLGA